MGTVHQRISVHLPNIHGVLFTVSSSHPLSKQTRTLWERKSTHLEKTDSMEHQLLATWMMVPSSLSQLPSAQQTRGLIAISCTQTQPNTSKTFVVLIHASKGLKTNVNPLSRSPDSSWCWASGRNNFPLTTPHIYRKMIFFS